MSEPRTAAPVRVVRPRECFDPPVPVVRELLSARPPDPLPAAPPVLLVPEFGHGAWVYVEHWLTHVAERGFPAYAMSLRGHGESGTDRGADLRAYVHDVTQVAAGLPRQAILVGHGAGAAVVAMALARYPARAAALVAPAFGGPAAVATLVGGNPVGTLRALFGRGVRFRRQQLLSRELDVRLARGYLSRLGGASRRAQWQLARGVVPERPVGDPPVLVLGSPDDRVVSRAALERVARRYGGSPLLFPGMGHDMPLDVAWRAPVDAICDWLTTLVTSRTAR